MGALASAQTLSIVSGDGQVAAQNFQLASPLVVIARNGAGQPLPGVTVNWSISGPGNLVGSAQTVTDSSGQATNRYVGGTIYTDPAYTQSTVTASTGGSSVTFHVTTSGADLISGLVFVQAQVLAPLLGEVLTGAAGSVGASPVKVNVYGVHNAGLQQVPNIAIRLIPANPSGPTVACAAGTGITDSNGNANCRVVFGGSPGSSTFSVEVGGGFRTFDPFRFTVTQGTGQSSAFRITITGGNNQSGSPGSQLPARLTARVEDAFGLPVPNMQVVWQPSSSVSLSAVVSTSDASGMVSATATLGSQVGPAVVQVSTANGAGQATFSLTVGQGTTPGTPGTGQGVPAALRILSGNNQTGPPGSALPSPLSARVEDASGNPLSNIPVAWQPSQSVSVSNASSVSDANGIVSATALLGSLLGPTQVQLRTISTSQSPFGQSVNIATAVFNLTVGGSGVTPTQPNVPALLRVLSGDNQTGSPGALLPVTLTARVEDSSGVPLPNVPVVWQPSQSVSLSNFSSASNANGIVSATVILGASSGAAQVQLRTVSTSSTPFGPSVNIVTAVYNMTIAGTAVTPGPPSTAAVLRMLGGNNQTGSPGALLPSSLVARVEDTSGNPVANAAVVWQPSQSVSLGSFSSVSDGNGIVSASVILGSVSGTAQVQLRTVTGTPIQTVFSLTISGTTTPPVQSSGAATALHILSGDNQTGPPGSRLPAPLIARVEDSSGRPVPNVPVIWETSQGVTLSGSTSPSDGSGIVTAIATLGPAAGYAQVVLRTTGGFQTPFGTTPGATLQTVFSLNAAGQPQAGPPAALRVLGGDSQSGPAGSRLPLTLTARVEDAFGNPVSNVPVIWQPGAGQTLSLTNLVSVSDAGGLVSANAQLSFIAGPAQAQVRIANTSIQAFFNLAAVVQAQPAALLRILTGDNQSGTPGPLPVTLTARVEDAAGNPIPNVPVVWLPITPQTVSLGSPVSVSDANGIVSATAILSAAGAAQVQVRVINLPVLTLFNLQVRNALSGITIIEGVGQEATTGSTFAAPIVVQLLAGGDTASAGLPVQITSTGAPIGVANGGLALTDSSGRAVIEIEAGPTAGTARVTATSGAYSISFFLTIRDPQAAPALSFFNAASGQASAISPTALVAIYGAGVAPLQGCSSGSQPLGPLPFSLSGVRVQFASGGYSAFAPLYSLCNLGVGQEYVVVQTPADLPLTDTTVTVQVAGAVVAQARIAAAPVVPGIFETEMSDGVKRAVLQRQDGSYVSLESPVQAGEQLRAFVTGLGRPVTSSGVLINTNQSGTFGDDAVPQSPVTVRLAGRDIQPVSTVYSTESIGVYVLTFNVPGDIQTGADVDFGILAQVGDRNIIGKLSKLPVQ